MADSGVVYVCDFTDWRDCVVRLLDKAGLMAAIGERKQILIKPNLVEVFQPPITTPVGLVEEIVNYLQEKNKDLKILIGEGTGAREYNTFYPFQELGYVEMAKRRNVELIDLNEEPLRFRQLPQCHRWPEMYLPEIIFDSFLLSVPVLKAHSLSSVTLTMKNMVGCAPPSHYQKGGHWKKSSFHDNIHAAVLDLNRYRTPDFTVLDATIGMQEAHLWGPTCNPPHRKLAASEDPVAIDAYGAGLLGRNWKQIDHLAGAHKELGLAEPLKLLKV